MHQVKNIPGSSPWLKPGVSARKDSMAEEEYEQLFSLVSAFEDGENGFILAINALNEIAKLKKTDAEGEDV